MAYAQRPGARSVSRRSRTSPHRRLAGQACVGVLLAAVSYGMMLLFAWHFSRIGAPEFYGRFFHASFLGASLLGVLACLLNISRMMGNQLEAVLLRWR